MILFLIFLVYILYNIQNLNLYILFFWMLFFILYFIFVRFYHKNSKQINKENSIKWFEIKYSIISLLIYFFIIIWVFYLLENWVISFSLDFWWEVILYLVLFVLYHDVYFYFSHRFMHTPLLYRYGHIQHHKSRYSNIMSAYNFGVLEAFIYVWAIFPIFIFDLNIYAFLWAVFINDFGNIIWHSGYEYFSKKEIRSNKLFRFLATASYHDSHHTNSKGNYSLYFGYLDKLFWTDNNKK